MKSHVELDLSERTLIFNLQLLISDCTIKQWLHNMLICLFIYMFIYCSLNSKNITLKPLQWRILSLALILMWVYFFSLLE